MKKIIVVLLICSLVLSGCALQNNNIQQNDLTGDNVINVHEKLLNINIDDYNINNLSDTELLRYMKDSVYYNLVSKLNTDVYFVENVDAIYISKEYIDELEYNSKSNIYFGYTLEELEQQFQGTKYIFTLDDDGQTIVKEFEAYDDTYDKAIKNIAIGTGIILFCVTVSVVSGGVGATAISMIFAASAKSAAAFGISGGVISGVASGVIKGMETKDFSQALKAGVSSGSENFKWCALIGGLTGGVQQAAGLYKAKLKGLTMNQAAAIQKESKYSLEVIKHIKSMDEYKIYKDIGLTSKTLNSKPALIRNIDLNYVDEKTGLTNLQLMKNGLSPYDSLTKTKYELHHIGQEIDSPLAILTKSEHRLKGNNSILHNNNIADGEGVHKLLPQKEWNRRRKEFWKSFAELFAE